MFSSSIFGYDSYKTMLQSSSGRRRQGEYLETAKYTNDEREQAYCRGAESELIKTCSKYAGLTRPSDDTRKY